MRFLFIWKIANSLNFKVKAFFQLKIAKSFKIIEFTIFHERTTCSLNLKDLAIFRGERMLILSEWKNQQSFKIKESCNLSLIQYAIFYWNKSILLTRKIGQIFQMQRTKRSFWSNNNYIFGRIKSEREQHLVVSLVHLTINTLTIRQLNPKNTLSLEQANLRTIKS